MPDFQSLRDRPLFVMLADDAFGKIADVAEYLSFAPGDVLVQEGTMLNALLILESGEVEVVTTGESGEEQKLAVLKGTDSLMDQYLGGIIGEMSLVDFEPTSSTVRATSDGNYWRLTRSAIQDTLDEDYEAQYMLVLNIARMLSRRLRDTNRRANTPSL